MTSRLSSLLKLQFLYGFKNNLQNYTNIYTVTCSFKADKRLNKV